MLYPLKFKPEFKNYIWGGRNLEKLGKSLPEGKIAEAWEVSCHRDGVSAISNGIFEGLSLNEFMEKMGNHGMGRELYNYKKVYFPLLLKLIDANEKLSIQVHPGDNFAYTNENGEGGKHEAWYIIDAKPGSQIIHGVKPGVDKESFLKAVGEEGITRYLNYIDVYAGDVINVSPGIIHGVGEGILLAEIQQSSNIAYRIYDYDRIDENGNKRPLQLKKALKVIDFYSNDKKGRFVGLDVQIGSNSTKSYRLANRYFSLEVYNINGEVEENADGRRFYIYLIIEGEALINYKNGSICVKRGESILIPAAMGKYILSGSFKALKTYVPDLQQDIVLPLVSAGYTFDEICENVFGMTEFLV
jgi:mannose-6-phosphate isomerase